MYKTHFREYSAPPSGIVFFPSCCLPESLPILSFSAMSDWNPLECSQPCSSIHGIFQARLLEWVAIFFFQRIFLTQGLNPGVLCLLHCRQILYPLSHQGLPKFLQIKVTEDKMVGWHHQLDGHEFEQALAVGDGQGSLVCYSAWSHKELDTTERLSWLSQLRQQPPWSLNSPSALKTCSFFKAIPGINTKSYQTPQNTGMNPFSQRMHVTINDMSNIRDYRSAWPSAIILPHPRKDFKAEVPLILSIWQQMGSACVLDL